MFIFSGMIIAEHGSISLDMSRYDHDDSVNYYV